MTYDFSISVVGVLGHEAKKSKTNAHRVFVIISLNKIIKLKFVLKHSLKKKHTIEVCFLDMKTKFIKFCTKFWVKQVQFLPSEYTSLLLHCKPVRRNYLHIFKDFKT